MRLFTIENRLRLLEEELKRIVRIIENDYRPEKIILFGSLATGKIHEWSDIDLLIIKETNKRPIERNVEIANMTHPHVGIDLFIYTPEEFNFLLNEKISLLVSILKEGKVLYEKRN